MLLVLTAPLSADFGEVDTTRGLRVGSGRTAVVDEDLHELAVVAQLANGVLLPIRRQLPAITMLEPKLCIIIHVHHIPFVCSDVVQHRLCEPAPQIEEG
ncbi:hypothetical protein PAXRUDRAFT_833389 [Paxillus rubicundulus Ve08.2h10]|uniref:Uncharacterized protein n=1 Tax=Paxillus rubicundulus Ve08.2h10 TaxID=930991 RepID=A0A0D0CYF5_9AGAM|nr:hypothetical protein PAXRUDRAFT_833389 [Paxillus rubicundulus Ve08.2h10]